MFSEMQVLGAQASDLEFDWSQYRVSVADLVVTGESRLQPGGNIRFRHNKADFNREEQEAYLRLWEAIG